jgi:ACS family hexuronate transporter-like MFS transporter
MIIPGKSGKYRWRIIALLFFATTINYIDRQVIGILAPYISDELGWSELDYGHIVTAFQVAYAVGLILLGNLLDKIGTRIGYTVTIVVWSIAAIGHAFARSVVGFVIARFFLGLGESGNFPAAIKSVAEWFPKKERAYATGWFNAGSTVGAITAPLIVPVFALHLGWKWAFIITGFLGFVWIIFWLLYYHKPVYHPGLSSEEYSYINQDGDDSSEHTPWLHILPHKETIGLCLTRFISDWVWWFFLFWLPKFLNDLYGITLDKIGLPLIIIYVVSSIGGITGGWLSSKMIRNGRSIDFARKTTILICALCVLPVFFVSKASFLWIAVVIISLATAAHQGWAANMFAIISDIYPRNAVGSITGLAGMTGAIGGALAATFIGFIRESTGSYSLVFAIAASAYLINWIIIKILIPRIEPVDI